MDIRVSLGDLTPRVEGAKGEQAGARRSEPKRDRVGHLRLSRLGRGRRLSIPQVSSFLAKAAENIRLLTWREQITRQTQKSCEMLGHVLDLPEVFYGVMDTVASFYV